MRFLYLGHVCSRNHISVFVLHRYHIILSYILRTECFLHNTLFSFKTCINIKCIDRCIMYLLLDGLLDGFWLVGRGVHSILDVEFIALNLFSCFYLDRYQIYFERFSRYLFPVYICARHTFTHVHTHTYIYIYYLNYFCLAN